MFRFSKKAIAIALAVLSLISLCSCGSTHEELAINNHAWEFNYVQNDDGKIIYCNADNRDLYEEAEVLEFWNSVKGGVFIIENEETQESFGFVYKIKEENPDTFLYDMAYTSDDGAKYGSAVVRKTIKEEGNNEYTLIINIEGYSIYFYESIK